MGQLIFNDEFDNIVNEPLSYWKTSDDIPKNIRSYILDEVSKLWLIDDSGGCCSNCLGELNNDFTCNQCGKKYDNSHRPMLVDYAKLKEDKYSSAIVHFYVYDIINAEVILYQIDVLLYYHNPFISEIKKTTSLLITRALSVQKDKCIDLINNKIIQYQNFSDIHCDIKYKSNNDDIRFLYMRGEESFVGILYPNNLDCLKDTIYKYSHLWDLKDNIVKNNYLSLETLILYPIYYPQFEYLVKMKLYNLALYSADKFTKGKTFHDVFGVSSDYLSFMQKIDIFYQQLEVLRLCKKKDLSLINFFEKFPYLCEKLLKLGINVTRVVQYFEDNHIENYIITDYIDYIDCATKLGLNLKDKNVLFPSNLMEEHNRLYLQVEILNNPDINNKIRELSNILKFNYYEDDKYMIFPAETLEDMLDEGSQQHNCLRTYIVEYSNNNCQIYFMREKDKKSKSLVTIEVRGGIIVQARTRFNKLPNNEIMRILRKWEKTLLPIENEE